MTGQTSYPQAPTVDVAGLFEPGTQAHSDAVQDMVRAIERTSVFVAAGLPDGATFDQDSAQLLRFFELDEEIRRELILRRSDPAATRMYRGYYESSPERRFAFQQYFDIGPDREMEVPALRDASMFAESNAWPSAEPYTGWRKAMLDHHRKLEKLGMAILRGIGSAFGLSQDEITRRFADGNSTMRLLRYPLRPVDVQVEQGQIKSRLGHDPDEPAMSIGRHTDGCCLSLLWQRDPGLQGQGPGDIWYEVPPVPNSISVHLGDMVESMTRGALKATPHRVFQQQAERRSLGFFLEPKLSASCAPLDACAEEQRGGLDTYAAMLLRRHSEYPGYEGIVHDPDVAITESA